MIREAQKYVYKYCYCSDNDWICLIDADIYVPSKLLEINLKTLNNKYIYGINRILDDGKINKKHKLIIGYFQLYKEKLL